MERKSEFFFIAVLMAENKNILIFFKYKLKEAKLLHFICSLCSIVFPKRKFLMKGVWMIVIKAAF